MSLWTFSSTVSEQRQAALLAVRTYDEVLEGLASPELYEIGVELGKQQASGLARVLLRLKVDRRVGDLFFNSPVGYRAQLSLSVEAGVDASCRAIRVVHDALIRRLEEAGQPLRSDWLAASLHHRSAKIWPDERWLPLYGSWLSDPIVEVPNPDWIAQMGNDDKACWGVRAPECEYFEVKGAWLTRDGETRIVKPVEQRYENVRRCGWT